MSRGFTICVLALFVSLFATTALQARVCNGNSDFMGQYAFSATREVFTNGLTGFPGVTGSTGSSGGTGGNPDLFPGYLFRGLRGLVVRTATGVPFEIEGTFWSDGNGNLFVFPGVTYMALTGTEIAALPKQVQIGTYTVSGDCTVTINFDTTTLETDIAIADALAAGQTSPGGSTPSVTLHTPTMSTFEGILVESGEEVDLVQNDMVGGSEMRLRHTIAPVNACTVSNLIGTFGLAARVGIIKTALPTGTGGTGNGSSFPNVSLYPIVGQLNADGLGNFTVTAGTTQSTSMAVNQISGTYTVNPDCTGTATLTVANPPAATPSTTPPNPGQPGSTSNIEFVLPRIPAAGMGPGNYLPEIDFVFTGYAISGAAIAKPE